MMIIPEDKTRMQELVKRTNHLWKFLKCDEKKVQIAKFEQEMSAPSFWDDQDKARKVGSENNRLKQTVSKVEEFRAKVEDLKPYANFVKKMKEMRKYPKNFLGIWRNCFPVLMTWKSPVF